MEIVLDLTFTYVQKDNSPRGTFARHSCKSSVSGRGGDDSNGASLFVSSTSHVFKGIEVAENQVMCVTRIAHMTDPSRFPLLLETTLSPTWRQAPLYQRLRNDTEVVPPHLRSAVRRILVRLR